MSTSGEVFPEWFNPIGGPEEVLATITLSQLVAVEAALAPPAEAEDKPESPWAKAIASERAERERNLESLRTYNIAVPDTPDYDPKKGPSLYIAKVREANLAGRPTQPSGPKYLGFRRDVNELAALYVSQNLDNLQFILGQDPAKGRLPQDDLADFLAINLWNVVSTPRIALDTTYQEQKRDILKRHMPGIVLFNADYLRDSARELGITRDHLQAARTEIEALPYKTILPDFFQLDTLYQATILGVLGGEWMKLCKLINKADPKLLTVRNYRSQASLAYRSAQELEWALWGAREDLEPSEVCKLFLKQPISFNEALAEATQVAADNRRLVETYSATGQGGTSASTRGEKVRLPENLRAIQTLLDDPEVNAEVLNLAFGETVEVTEHDKRILIKPFDSIVDKHAQLIGRAMWEGIKDKSPKGVKLYRWANFDISRVLRAKHNGGLLNLRITRLPVTAEELEETLKEQYDPQAILPDNVSRLIFEMDMKTTGIKATEPAFVDMLMIVRKGGKGADTIRKSIRGARSNGQDAALSLRIESEARAWVAELMNHRLGTLGVGLPSLGRHEQVARRS